MKKLIPLILLLLCSFSSHAQLPTTGLVAWYPFCGNTNDYSGNGYNMVNSGATLTTDRFGNPNCAYAFNGVNSVIYYSPYFPANTNLTYSCWIDPYSAQNPVIIYDGNTNMDGIGLIISGGTLSFSGNDVDILFGGVNQYLAVAASINQWHHLVLRRTSSTYDLFMDNILVGTITGTFNPPSGEFSLGLDYTNNTNPFNGKIDDVALYNRALSNTEISQLYNYSPDVIPIAPGNSTACAGNTITLSDAMVGGVWSSSNPLVATISGTGVVTSVSTGTSIISYSTGIGCVGTATVIVTPPPSAITGPIGVCAASVITLSDATPGGTWSSGSPGIATITPGTGIVSGVTAGTTVITYTTGPGCFTTAPVTVNPPPPPLVGATNICAGSTITLNDAIPGGTWVSSNAIVATVTPGPSGSSVVTGVAVGTTVITYTLTGSCFSTTTITVNPQPSAITGFTNVCAGSAITLSDPTSGGTWTSGNISLATVVTGTGVVEGVSSGIVTITYATIGSCIVTTTITVNPIPATISGPANACTGATINLSDIPGSGIWSSSNTAVATIIPIGIGNGTLSGIAPGVTTITYTLVSGCDKTTTITVYPTPSAITGTNNVCSGFAIMLGDSPAGGTWSSGNTAIAKVIPGFGVVTGVSGGTVTITYTTGGNCIATTAITVNTTPTVIAGSPNICTDGSTTLVASPGGGSWSINSASVATITPTSIDSAIIAGIGITAGTTIVTYSLLGCITTNTINTVHVLPPLTGPAQVCTGQSVTLSDSIIGGTWASTNTAVATVDEHAGIVVGVSAGVPTISYTIGGSCITSTTIIVHQSPNQGTITGLSNVCVGEIITVNDTVSGGVLSMSNGSATVSRDTVTGVFPGKDTVWYIAANTFCTDTATKPITIYRVPVVGPVTGQPVLCIDTMIILTDTARGGVWSSMVTSIATINSSGSSIVTGVSAGIDTIKYTVSNPGCSSIASYTVTVYAAPVPGIITGLPIVCAGSVFVLSDTTGGVWSSSNITVATINNTTGVVNALNAGTTTIHYTIGPNAGRCYGIATVAETITPQNTLSINSTMSQVTCYGDNNGSISVVVNGATSHLLYLWSNNDTIPMITGLAPGFDTLHVTESLTLCYVSDTLQITQPDSLHVSDTITQDKCKQGNGTVTTIVTGGTQPYSYLWSDNSTGSSLENLHAGTYTVTVTDINNCTQTIIAEVTNNDCIINVHDVITPNGDGINDTWIIEGIDNYPENKVQVFDKWGDMVYEKSNYNNDWNGKGKSGELPDGTYYYLVKLNAINLQGNQNAWTGSLLIKR